MCYFFTPFFFLRTFLILSQKSLNKNINHEVINFRKFNGMFANRMQFSIFVRNCILKCNNLFLVAAFIVNTRSNKNLFTWISAKYPQSHLLTKQLLKLAESTSCAVLAFSVTVESSMSSYFQLLKEGRCTLFSSYFFSFITVA